MTPTWPSARMTSWRTGSSRGHCPAGPPTPRRNGCWPSFAASFPLHRRSAIDNPDMVAYLLTRCEGTIGELARLLGDAAVAAITSGEEAINKHTLTMASYNGPSARRAC